MALTETQKAQARLYLGYSDQSRGGAGSPLEGALLGLSAGAETIVGATLTALGVVDASLGTVTSASRAGIVEVDNGGVKWAEDGLSAPRALEAHGRRLVARLEATLGVCKLSDIFGGSGGFAGPAGRG